MIEFFQKFHNLNDLVVWAGYFGLTLIVFCETGILAGFFLPGDSLLVTAGFIASQGTLDFLTLNALLMTAAVLGDSTGYMIGYYLGPRIFNRKESFFFRREYLDKTHQFFEKYGGKTIILARFVPIVRTFAPTVAGVGRMTYRHFFSYNIFGGILWVGSMLSVGYFLGKSIPNLEKSLHLVVLVVIIVSFLPIVFEAMKTRRKKSQK